MIGDSLQLPKDFDPRSWLREFEQLLRRRHRAQGRVMGLAVVVGVVASWRGHLFCRLPFICALFPGGIGRL